jgi:hypothetical protein
MAYKMPSTAETLYNVIYPKGKKMDKIEKLTQEQVDSMPKFRSKWIAIGTDTSKIDHVEAIKASNLSYKCANLPNPKFFIFPSGPKEAMKFISFGKFIDFTETDFANLSALGPYALTKAIRAKVEKAEKENPDFTYTKVWPGFYGQHEAGWLSLYDFFAEHFNLSELSAGIRALALHSGWVWLYGDLVIICEKPTRLTLNATGDLHNEKTAAIEYNDGTKVYSFNGVVIPAKWVIERDTIDPSEILSCTDVDKRAAGIALYGYARLKHSLNYNVLEGDPETDIGALIEITIPGLSRKGRFLEAICPRNGPVFLGVPLSNPWDNGKDITSAVGAQAFLARLPESAYSHPPIRT